MTVREFEGSYEFKELTPEERPAEGHTVEVTYPSDHNDYETSCRGTITDLDVNRLEIVLEIETEASDVDDRYLVVFPRHTNIHSAATKKRLNESMQTATVRYGVDL